MSALVFLRRARVDGVFVASGMRQRAHVHRRADTSQANFALPVCAVHHLSPSTTTTSPMRVSPYVLAEKHAKAPFA